MNVIHVSGMGCGSCVAKITQAIKALDQQAQVSVDLTKGQVGVESSLALAQVHQVITSLGFTVQ